MWGFLLAQAHKPGNDALKKKVALTLAKMAEGGIYDHLGGGFHRYSTERTWTVPHFEKMLYDNAQLVELYAKRTRSTRDPQYKRVVAETLGVRRARDDLAGEGGSTPPSTPTATRRRASSTSGRRTRSRRCSAPTRTPRS